MPQHYKLVGTYHQYNPYKVGDKIRWKRTGEEMRVGDDWEELNHWTGGDDRYHIVTDTGRVLHIDEIEHC